MRSILFSFFVLFPVACTVSANVGDFPPNASSDGGDLAETSTPPAEGGLPPADTGTAMDATVDAGCGVTLSQQGSFVDVLSMPGAQPTYTGGTFTAGVYVLKSITYYIQKTGTAEYRETLRIRGAMPNGALERIVEQRNPSGDYEAIPAHGETSTWMSQGDIFFFESPTCPTTDFLNGQYTASGTTLTIYTGNGMPFQRVYERISD